MCWYKMLEQRNAFISEMNTSFTSQKKKLNNILSTLRWTPQSVSGSFKEGDDVGTSEFISEVAENLNIQDNMENIEGRENLDNLQIVVKDTGTSRDSEKQYNELLASLSFQPKVKQEKLSDTQLLASLLESERNAKRRRISYRNKVHTKNKSHTEVLREVIREQMETLNDEEVDNSKTDRTSGKKEEEDEMFEVREMDGNPHLAWQIVGLVVEEQQRVTKKQHDKISSNHRHEYKSSDHSHERSGSDHRKHHRHSRSDMKHPRTSPHFDDSANYHRSRHSRSNRTSRDRSSKSKHKSSRKHSKHKRHDR